MNWHHIATRIVFPGCVLACGALTLYAADEDASQEPALFEQLDKNGDGVLERSELTDDRQKFFDRIVRVADENEDGKLTATEFAEAIKPNRPVATEAFGDGNPNQQRGRDITQMIRRLDRDGNQKISKDEIPDPLRERLMPLFERLGKDELTMQEFQAGMARGMHPQDFTNRLFSQLDRNKNDKIELSELPERMRENVERVLQQMGKADADGLTKEEFAQVIRRSQPRGMQPRGPQPPAIFQRLDADRNGSLSKAEIAKAPEILATMDANGDGEITPDEIERTARSGMRPNAGPRPENRDGFPRFLQEADENKDGKISKDEAPERMKRGFDRIDADGDGFITPEEAQKMFDRRPQSN